jgi:DNA-binding MarR family transcriptional regulator
MSGAWPEDDVAPAIASTGRAMTAAIMSRLIAQGFDQLTPAITSIITLIGAEGIRPSALAQRANVTKQATSQLLRLLTERGFVEQVTDPVDTRAKLIRVTQLGASLKTACLEARSELRDVAVRELGGKNAERLRADLERLCAAFQDRATAQPTPHPKGSPRKGKYK